MNQCPVRDRHLQRGMVWGCGKGGGINTYFLAPFWMDVDDKKFINK